MSGNDSEKIHDIENYERKEKTSKSFARNMDKDFDADPDIEIPERISPSSEMNLETVLRNLGSILQNSKEKHSHSVLVGYRYGTSSS